LIFKTGLVVNENQIRVKHFLYTKNNFMPKKIGRPRLAKKNALGEVFSVRLRPDEARNVASAIRASGQARANWLRNALIKAASKQ